jgi:catechol 2,3-dioxygenase-like lactoylglutathione lyase family enzyme
VRQSGRWQLTDFQRFLVVAAVVTSMFLAAMSLGMGSIVLLLIAVLLIVVVWLGIFLLGIRFNGRAGLTGEAHVVMAPPPPANQIIGRCDLRLVVELPGRGSSDIKLRDPAVPVTKWPRIGQVLPVEVDPRNARQIRVRWDLVDEHRARPATVGAGAEEATAFAAPFYTDYADGALDAEYSPTPRTPALDPTPATVAVEEYRPGSGPPELSDTIHWGDPLDLEELDALHPDVIEDSPTPPRPQDIETIEVEPSVRAEAAGFELPVRGIPQPRRDERPMSRQVSTPAENSGAEDGENHAMGVMLVVSDLARSVRFYRDLVGFTVVDSSATTAVLAYGGGRVLLRQLVDMSPVDRRVAHLHISVNDVEAAYRELHAKGVPFAHKPRVINRGDKLDLWAATFRDPDGHDVAITQWRDRDELLPPARS